MVLNLIEENYTSARRIAFRRLEAETPDAILGSVKAVVGEALKNCFEHGKDKKVWIDLEFDTLLCVFVVTVIADSHRVHIVKISDLLFGYDRRHCCGPLTKNGKHGWGLNVIRCGSDKVTLDKSGRMKLYFACVPPDLNLAGVPFGIPASPFCLDQTLG
jgi:anti-sigma regulatory factor (Ser/Thr protein kinase)